MDVLALGCTQAQASSAFGEEDPHAIRVSHCLSKGRLTLNLQSKLQQLIIRKQKSQGHCLVLQGFSQSSSPNFMGHHGEDNNGKGNR